MHYGVYTSLWMCMYMYILPMFILYVLVHVHIYVQYMYMYLYNAHVHVQVAPLVKHLHSMQYVINLMPLIFAVMKISPGIVVYFYAMTLAVGTFGHDVHACTCAYIVICVWMYM